MLSTKKSASDLVCERACSERRDDIVAYQLHLSGCVSNDRLPAKASVEMQRRLASATLLFNKEGISLGVDPLLRQRRDESLVSPIPDQREHPERGLPCRYRDPAACGVAQEAAALTEAALALAAMN
jgi:hypothetical protein